MAGYNNFDFALFIKNFSKTTTQNAVKLIKILYKIVSLQNYLMVLY